MAFQYASLASTAKLGRQAVPARPPAGKAAGKAVCQPCQHSKVGRQAGGQASRARPPALPAGRIYIYIYIYIFIINIYIYIFIYMLIYIYIILVYMYIYIYVLVY